MDKQTRKLYLKYCEHIDAMNEAQMREYGREDKKWYIEQEEYRQEYNKLPWYKKMARHSPADRAFRYRQFRLDPMPPRQKTLDDFYEWLAKREDAENYKDSPYRKVN